MALKEFIDIIRKGRKTSRAREKVGADLCEALGAIELDAQTLKKWVYKMRTPDPERFFQQGLTYPALLISSRKRRHFYGGTGKRRSVC